MTNLTPRDLDIISYLNSYQGGTIEQITKLFFNNYDTCRIRLKKLENANFIKSQKHPILNKKVYYYKKYPSYHTLICNNILILLKDKIKVSKREYKINNFKVDLLLVTNSAKVVIVEVDIFNRTSENKVSSIKKGIYDKLNLNCSCIIVNRNKYKKRKDVINININQLEKIKEEVN